MTSDITSPHTKLSPSADMLKDALDKAGVKYSTNDNEDVIVSPEVTEFLAKKNLLHDPENPTVVKMDGSGPIEKGYRLVTYEGKDEVTEALNTGSITRGEFPPISGHPSKTEQATYVGPIGDLQGKTADVLVYPNLKVVAAQFDDPTLVLNGKALGFGRHPFFAVDFGLTDDKAKKRTLSQTLKNIGVKGVRLTNEGKLQSGKTKRKGTKGAFGSSPAAKEFKLIVDTNIASRGIVIVASSFKKAQEVAMVQAKEFFPSEEVISIRKAM